MPHARDAALYRRIVVTLDGSPVAEEALPHALAQARAFGAELILLRVVPSVLARRPAPLTDADRAPREQGQDAAPAAYLAGVAETLSQQGVDVHSHLGHGPVVLTIVRAVQDLHADLLVLTTHGAGLVPRMLLGSVAAQLLTQAPCPLVLVRASRAAQGGDHLRSFAADAAHDGPLAPRQLGLRTVALDRIVGSVGRAQELRADFLPRHQPQGDQRYARIRAALERGVELPPIELYKLGYHYYVLDGNHRVAAARAVGQHEIEAEVTEYLPLDDAAAQQVFLERHAFEAATGLMRVGATRPGSYARLQEIIRAYGQRVGCADLAEAAQRWYVQVYLPLASQVQAVRLERVFPGERTADLMVRLADLCVVEAERRGRAVGEDEALALLLARYRPRRRPAALHLPHLGRLLSRQKRETGHEGGGGR